MAIILHKSPFDPTLLTHNEAQLDFILEMYSLDNPNILKFNRPGKLSRGVEQSQASASWADVLTGEAYDNYMASKMPSKSVLAILRGMRELSTVTPMKVTRK